MVHRQSLIRVFLALGAALAGVSAARPAVARASDAKVAIGDYRWSHPVVSVDLGQRATWYWVSPDTMHSVTGVSANDVGEDSDPNRPEPEHRVGDTFRLSFTQPGVYQFRCKLHPVVHGEVIVSATPGDPADDPDPIPRLNVDLTRPTLNDIFLASRRLTLRGTELHLALDDPSVIDAEIWHADAGAAAPRTPAGSSGAATSASTSCRSPPAGATSSPGRDATSPTSRPPTCTTTSAARGPCASRSADRWWPGSAAGEGGRVVLRV